MPKLTPRQQQGDFGPQHRTALESAVEWAIQGRPVLPLYAARPGGRVCTCGKPKCKSPGKHPTWANGTLDATTDVTLIEKLGRANPNLNWGMTLENLVVVDIDISEGKTGEATWAALCTETHSPTQPPTYTIRTGRGGRHLVFALPPEFKGKFPAKLGDYVDIKTGVGHLVVLPGSATENTYEVLVDAPIQPAPQWLLDRQKSPIGGRVTGAGSVGQDRPRQFTAAEGWAYLAPIIETWEAAVNGERHDAAGRAIACLWHFIGDDGLFTNETAYDYFVEHAPPGVDQEHLDKAATELLDPDYVISSGDRWKATIVAQLATDPEIADAVGFNGSANARQMVLRHGSQLRYTRATGWLVWDGHRWASDELDYASRCAQATAKALLKEAADIVEDDRRKQHLNWANQSLSLRGVEEMTRLARTQPEVRVASSKLDSNPSLFNTPSGTLDLRTGAVAAHRQADLITKMSGAPLGSHPSPAWVSFLEQILPDPEVRGWVQKLFGVALLGEVREHVMPIFIGSGGNGKGTLRDAVKYAFGEYAIEVGQELLMQTKHQRHAAFKMRLRGARLVFTSETEEGTKFNEAEMKLLTGGDEIEANHMRENPITFVPSHTLVMLTNKEPEVSGADDALIRRIRVVPFNTRILDKDKDPMLSAKLRAEAPAVLAWCWEGWQMYQQAGLQPPAQITRRTEEYFEDADLLAQFLATECTKGLAQKVSSSVLFSAFQEFAGFDEIRNKNEFNRRMRAHGYSTTKVRGVMMWQGVSVAEEAIRSHSSYNQNAF